MFYERKLKDMKYVLLYPIIRLLHLKEFVVDNKLANLSNLKIWIKIQLCIFPYITYPTQNFFNLGGLYVFRYFKKRSEDN